MSIGARTIMGALALLVMFAGVPHGAAALTVTSSAFDDGGLMAAKYAGHFITKRGEAQPTDCGGENISPPLAWSGAPAGVKSFALIVFDPDGNKGVGAAHWVAYGIAPDRESMPEGFGSKPSPVFVGGKNIAGATTYDGPCPTVGHINHYIFSVFALDLDRTALPPGLTRDQFLAAVQGHVLDVQSMIGRSPYRQR